jgi:hypothetical protein
VPALVEEDSDPHDIGSGSEVFEKKTRGLETVKLMSELVAEESVV